MMVVPDTPAADAGLRRHDVVIEMGGKEVRTADEAKLVVDESSVGDILTLKVHAASERAKHIVKCASSYCVRRTERPGRGETGRGREGGAEGRWRRGWRRGRGRKRAGNGDVTLSTAHVAYLRSCSSIGDTGERGGQEEHRGYLSSARAPT